MNEKIRGVNVGGWLVLEKWMAPNLFKGTKADDEYYLAFDLPPEEYRARIETHRSEFITEADFLQMAKAKINLVRIPVPYFIFGDRKPFIGAIDHLDKAFNWARAYGLKILLDLHTVPGSQNGFDNGGLSGVCKWAQDDQEVDFALSVLTRLAERYKADEALWGIQILNEPITEKMWHVMKPYERYSARDPEMAKGSQPITLDFLKDFYKRSYEQLRKVLPEEVKIVFHDAFELNEWEDFFTNNPFKNVVLDTHQYLMFGEMTGVDQTLEAYTNYLQKIGQQIAKVSAYVPVIVGEWSLFNSLAVGADTKGGINPTQETFDQTNKLSDEDLKHIYQTLWTKSVENWNLGDGHIYWTYKLNIDTINDPSWYGWDAWDFSRCIAKEWIK